MPHEIIIKTLRYTAHIIGGCMLLLFIVFAIGEGGVPPLFQLDTLGVLIMLAGLVVAWKNNIIGGLLVLVGYVLFALINWNNWFRAPVPFIVENPFTLFVVCALLYIVCGWMHRNRRDEKKEATTE